MANKNDKLVNINKNSEQNFNKLKEKHRLFAEAYIIDHNAKDAAIKAGYSAKGASVQGCRVLKDEKVQSYISHLEGETPIKNSVDYDYVINNLKSLVSKNTDKNPSVALRGLELIGKHLGMFEHNASNPEERPAFVGISINFGTDKSVKNSELKDANPVNDNQEDYEEYEEYEEDEEEDEDAEEVEPVPAPAPVQSFYRSEHVEPIRAPFTLKVPGYKF